MTSNVIEQLRANPGKWALIYQDPAATPNIPSAHLRDVAGYINLGRDDWAPPGAYSAVIRDDSDLYVVYNYDHPTTDEVEITYRASLKYGGCFNCGRPGACYLVNMAMLMCPLCAADAAVDGAPIARVQR